MRDYMGELTEIVRRYGGSIDVTVQDKVQLSFPTREATDAAMAEIVALSALLTSGRGEEHAREDESL